MPKPKSTRYAGMKVHPKPNTHSKKELKKPDPKEIRVSHKYRRTESGRKTVRLHIYEKHSTYLRFYELLLEYYSNKLNVDKDFLRIMFFFYDGYAFKRAEFTKYAKMVSVSKYIALSGLIKCGFVRQLEKGYYVERDMVNKKHIKIPYYAITHQCSVQLRLFYENLNKFVELDAQNTNKQMVMSEEVAQMYNSYIRKINNFRKGLGHYEMIVPIELKPKKQK